MKAREALEGEWHRRRQALLDTPGAKDVMTRSVARLKGLSSRAAQYRALSGIVHTGSEGSFRKQVGSEGMQEWLERRIIGTGDLLGLAQWLQVDDPAVKQAVQEIEAIREKSRAPVPVEKVVYKHS